LVSDLGLVGDIFRAHVGRVAFAEAVFGGEIEGEAFFLVNVQGATGADAAEIVAAKIIKQAQIEASALGLK